jgi:indole-3-acetaldehyde oxidase
LEISTQVEIDVLTGATTILRSDLVYDCGQSLNPAVDLGQVSPKTKAGAGPIDHFIKGNTLLL